MVPNLIIIGAQKCGTTSLHYYLNCHPEIIMSPHKELNFFNEDLNWHKGRQWYESHFVGKAKIYGEASPNYTIYPIEKGVAARMHSLIPNAQLIYMVRDPIERIISQYLDRVKGGQETRTFSHAVEEVSDNIYIYQSKYFMQIEQYLPYYSKSNILIVSAEELKNERRKVLQKAFRFLGVDDSFTCDEFSEIKNISEQKLKRKKPKRIIRYLMCDTPDVSPTQRMVHSLIPKCIKNKIFVSTQSGEKISRPVLSEELKQKLIDTFKNDVARLRAFTGCDFKEWCL